jgi:hypothetical protein
MRSFLKLTQQNRNHYFTKRPLNYLMQSVRGAEEDILTKDLELEEGWTDNFRWSWIRNRAPTLVNSRIIKKYISDGREVDANLRASASSNHNEKILLSESNPKVFFIIKRQKPFVRLEFREDFRTTVPVKPTRGTEAQILDKIRNYKRHWYISFQKNGLPSNKGQRLVRLPRLRRQPLINSTFFLKICSTSLSNPSS